MIVIGIDGGGTNSRAVLCDEGGHVFALAKAGPVNQNSVSLQQVKSAFQFLIQQIQLQAPAYFQQVEYLFAGVAGTGKEEARVRIQRMLEGLLPLDVPVEVQHDGYNALFSGTLGDPGVVQISGTGSLTFGVNAHNETARAGGWGYLFGDEGSGYALGRDALTAMARAEDGWGERTALTDHILNHFNIENPYDIIPHIYNHTHPRQQIAELSRYVIEAASKQDPVAESILQKACKELADQIRAVTSRLFPEQQTEIPVVLTGGVFNKADLIIPILQRSISQKVKLIQPSLSPLGGAAVAALSAKNVVLDQTFDQEFKQSKF